MHSMTGYGRGALSRSGVSVTVEVACVNRKQTDLRFVIPREWSVLEPRLRSRVQKQVGRGAYTFSLTLDLSLERRVAQVEIDLPVAAAMVAKLRRVATELKLQDDLRLADLLTVPGVVGESTTPRITDDVVGIAEETLDGAMADLRRMQETEGAALQQDLSHRHTQLRHCLAEIKALADQALVNCRNRLRERVRVLGVDLPLDDERLAKEVVFCAERSDIAEETTRLESHLDQFAEMLQRPEAAGRSLDFLCQEMSREINTLAAKTSETEIVHLALAFKGELDRVREQVQNIE